MTFNASDSLIPLVLGHKEDFPAITNVSAIDKFLSDLPSHRKAGLSISLENQLVNYCVSVLWLSRVIVTLEGGGTEVIRNADNPQKFGFLKMFFEPQVNAVAKSLNMTSSRLKSKSGDFSYATLTSVAAAALVLLRSSALGNITSFDQVAALKYGVMSNKLKSVDILSFFNQHIGVYKKWFSSNLPLDSPNFGETEKISLKGIIRPLTFALFVSKVEVVTTPAEDERSYVLNTDNASSIFLVNSSLMRTIPTVVNISKVAKVISSKTPSVTTDRIIQPMDKAILAWEEGQRDFNDKQSASSMAFLTRALSNQVKLAATVELTTNASLGESWGNPFTY